ncbi:MAG TPA: hypothetical protein VFG44_09540, partial [Burkholderiales bacterium]|nr:hypothetical protein [Burkholderiales bacterium]
MALLGPAGLAAVARACHSSTLDLLRGLSAIESVERAFSAPVFHEFVLRLETPVAPVLRALKAQGILGGLSLTHDYPELGQSLLICATETKSEGDLKRYSDNMARILGKRYRPASCAQNKTVTR